MTSMAIGTEGRARSGPRPYSSAGIGQSTSTEVGLLLSFIGGACLGVAFYACVILSFRATRFGQIFLNRGWVTPLEALLASWAICFMGIKALQLIRQRGFARHTLFLDATTTLDGAEAIAALQEKLGQSAETHHGSILHRRAYRAMDNYRLHSDRAAVSDLLNSLAIVDSARTENSFTVLRVLIWAIPIVGFIGTVVGLGGAVGGFSESLPKATDFAQLKGLLTGVTGGLSVAFDATFVALLISILLMFPSSLLEKRELDLLADIDEYCHHEILGRLLNTASPAQAISPIDLMEALNEAFLTHQQKFIEWMDHTKNDALGRENAAMAELTRAASAITASTNGLQSSVEMAAKQADEKSRLQQERFNEWWVGVNADVMGRMGTAMDGISQASRAITNSATGLNTSVEAAARQAEDIARQQQARFIEWWIGVNTDVMGRLETSMNVIGQAAGSITISANGLKTSVEDAAKQADGITAQMKIGAEHAGRTADALKLARGEAEGLLGFVHKAAQSATGIQSACDNANGHALSIATSLATAKDHANDVQSSTAATKQHMVDAVKVAQEMKAQVEKSIRDARLAALSQAQEQFKSFANQVSGLNSATPGADGRL